jgi:hypothetical protein
MSGAILAVLSGFGRAALIAPPLASLLCMAYAILPWPWAPSADQR